MRSSYPWIAVDIDGVLADFTFAGRDWLSKRGLIPRDAVHGQGAQRSWFWTDVGEEMVRRLFDEADDSFFEEMPYLCVPADKHALWRFYQHVGQVVYVTERPTRFLPATGRWLLAAGLPSANRVLCVTNKASFIAAYGADERPLAIIDDKPAVLEGLIEAGVANVFVRDFPYNRDYAGVQRVSSLEEFVHAAMRLAQVAPAH